jgi:hypothetical protein
MATDINIKSLFPALRNTHVARPATDIFNTSFIGIDFGTSTTVVSIATIDRETKEIITKPIWLNQKLDDGAIMSSEKIPTVIAWFNNQLLVGKGAADLKYQLKKGVNVWYSSISISQELLQILRETDNHSCLEENFKIKILRKNKKTN